GRLRDCIDVRELQFPEHDEFEDDGVQHAGGSRLGGTENAAVDTAHDDDRESERPHRLPHRLQPFAPGVLLLRRHVLDRGVDHAVHGEQHEDEQTGSDAGDEQFRDGGVGDHPVYDHADTGRDQEGDVAGVDDQRQHERVFVTGLEHARPQRRADGDHGGLGGSGHRTEQGAGGGGAYGQSAFHVADEGHDHVDQAVGRLAARHDVGGEDEHGHGDQRGGANAGHELLDHELHLAEAAEALVKADESRHDQRDHHRES